MKNQRFNVGVLWPKFVIVVFFSSYQPLLVTEVLIALLPILLSFLG